MPASTSDIQYIERLRNGDKSALYALYDKYSAALYGIILRICKQEDIAQDLLQETFIKIWQNIDSYDQERGRFYTWSYRIAKNISLNALRKKQNLIQTEDINVYKDKGEEIFTRDYSRLNGSLKKLEMHHQRALELIYFQGLTHREAHEEMGVPLGTFKSYVRQALRQLRKHYGAELLLFMWFLQVMYHG